MPKPSLKLVALSLLLVVATIPAAVMTAGLLAYLFLVLLFLIAAAVDLSITNLPHHLKCFVLKPIRLPKNTTADIDLHLEFPDGSYIPPSIRIGIPFPFPLEAEADEQEFSLQAETRNYSTAWRVHAPRRGLYHVDAIYWQVRSRLGLWLMRGKCDVDLSIRVHPNLRREKKALASLLMNRGAAGMKLQKAIGQGRDYDQIREYQQGDGLLDIHWKATARRNSLMAKTYQVERTQHVYILIDHSRLSARTIQTHSSAIRESVLERFITAANIVALAATRQGDLIGTAAFARYPTHFIRCGSGPAQLKMIQNSIYNLQPENVSPDFDELLTFCRLHIRQRSLVIILTDLSDPAAFESFYRKVDIISRRHLVLVNMISMAGVKPVFSRHDQLENVDICEQLAGHLIWKDLYHNKHLLARKRVTLQLLDSENLAAEMVNNYINVKRRQLI